MRTNTRKRWAPGSTSGVPPVSSGHGCTLNSYFLRPTICGSVTFQSARPDTDRLIDPNYVASKRDLSMTVKGLKMMRAIMGQPALAPYIKTEHYPDDDDTSDQDHIEYVRKHGRTSHHLVGTRKMGAGDDEKVVLDPPLRVRGVDRLRIRDSVVMPSIVSSNTNAATIMIDARTADLIRNKR